MNEFDRKLRKMAMNERQAMPAAAKIQVETVLDLLPEMSAPIRKVQIFPRVAAAVCAVLVIFFLLPNVSTSYAKAMEQIPVIGNLIHVITLRNYFYSDDYHEMDIQVPEIAEEENGQAAELINKDVDQLTSELVKHFYQEFVVVGNKGHGSIYVDYETVTNTEDWFTLKLSVLEAAGSSNSYYKYYHIDRRTGNIVQLGDLFEEESYQEVLEEEIRKQMRTQMQEDKNIIYWVDDNVVGDCVEIEKDHNFYFDQNGELVIPFDKYEVAPGSMGCPEFVIPHEVTAEIMKPEYVKE